MRWNWGRGQTSAGYEAIESILQTNRLLEVVLKWTGVNKLKLNPDKTEVLLTRNLKCLDKVAFPLKE